MEDTRERNSDLTKPQYNACEAELQPKRWVEPLDRQGNRTPKVSIIKEETGKGAVTRNGNAREAPSREIHLGKPTGTQAGETRAIIEDMGSRFISESTKATERGIS